jgi:serine O-acetyltransferase
MAIFRSLTAPVRKCAARMREDVAVVMERDPSAISRAEALLSPHLPALWLYRVAHEMYLHDHRALARFVSYLGRLLSGGIEIHAGATIGRRFFIDHGGGTVIGETAIIGDDVTLYHQVTLGAVGWWRDIRRAPSERRHPAVGNRVVIGAGSAVLGPVRVGDDARIGAHAIVTDDVPPGARVHPCNGTIDVPAPAVGNAASNGAAIRSMASGRGPQVS